MVEARLRAPLVSPRPPRRWPTRNARGASVRRQVGSLVLRMLLCEDSPFPLVSLQLLRMQMPSPLSVPTAISIGCCQLVPGGERNLPWMGPERAMFDGRRRQIGYLTAPVRARAGAPCPLPRSRKGPKQATYAWCRPQDHGSRQQNGLRCHCFNLLLQYTQPLPSVSTGLRRPPSLPGWPRPRPTPSQVRLQTPAGS